MELPLHPEDRRYIESQIAQGNFRSVEDLLANAISALRGLEFSPEHEEYLRREVQKGIDEADRGDVEPWNVDAFKRKLDQRLRDRNEG